jgi:hypothetical protein
MLFLAESPPRQSRPVFSRILSTAHYPNAHVVFICSEIFYGIDVALKGAKGDLRMKTIGTNAPVKSSLSAGIDWPIVTYWATYLSIVFGILYAAF